MTADVTFALTDLVRLLAESAGEAEGVDWEGDVLDTPFLELGYDSLALLQVTGRIKREYRLALPDDVVADALTPRRLLHTVSQAASTLPPPHRLPTHL